MDSPTASTNNPSEFLKTILGRVVVSLNSGSTSRCANNKTPAKYFTQRSHAFLPLRCAACLDGYMNIAMEQTEEYVNGQLKAKYGDTFIRGNNGAFALPLNHTPRTDCFCHRSRARVLPTVVSPWCVPSQCSTLARKRGDDRKAAD